MRKRGARKHIDSEGHNGEEREKVEMGKYDDGVSGDGCKRRKSWKKDYTSSLICLRKNMMNLMLRTHFIDFSPSI